MTVDILYFLDSQLMPALWTVRFEEKIHAFHSHDWGDSPDYLNHQRVKRIHEALTAPSCGLKLFLDEHQFRSNIDDHMSAGIDQSVVVLVYVTQKYMDKVKQTLHFDNCKKEFQYATRQKAPEMIIPVVMDRGMCSQQAWKGPLGLNLSHHFFIDMSEVWAGATSSEGNRHFSTKIAELHALIRDKTSGAIP